MFSCERAARGGLQTVASIVRIRVRNRAARYAAAVSSEVCFPRDTWASAHGEQRGVVELSCSLPLFFRFREPRTKCDSLE